VPPAERASRRALVLAVSGIEQMDDVRNDSGVGEVDIGDTLVALLRRDWPAPSSDWFGIGIALDVLTSPVAELAVAAEVPKSPPPPPPPLALALALSAVELSEVEVTMGCVEKSANGEKGVVGESMVSTEMKGMAKEPEERSGAGWFDDVAAVAEAVEEGGFSCEGGGPNANESEDDDDDDEEDDDDSAADDVDDEEVEENDDDGRLSELDLRKLLMSELVERVRAESVEALREERKNRQTPPVVSSLSRSLSLSVSLDGQSRLGWSGREGIRENAAGREHAGEERRER
jgi:hypothetical protein